MTIFDKIAITLLILLIFAIIGNYIFHSEGFDLLNEIIWDKKIYEKLHIVLSFILVFVISAEVIRWTIWLLIKIWSI